MILVIGQAPRAGEMRHGMLQRIAAMDRWLSPDLRVYLQPEEADAPSSAPFVLEDVGPGLRTAQPNLRSAKHMEQVTELAREASAVLVHSVYWAERVRALYPMGHVLTDMHGIVPEELRWEGSAETASSLERVEEQVLEQSRAVIVVTDAMALHFRNKYPRAGAEFVRLPVSMSPVPFEPRPAPPPWRVLYSGHSSLWQNADEMLHALQVSASPWSMDLLTDSVPFFAERILALGLGARIAPRSVPHDEVVGLARRAHLSFVLRNDHIVNRVSCPTKLSEAVAVGAVPILKSSSLGDFPALGLRYVEVDDFVAGRMPAAAEIEGMARDNLVLAQSLHQAAEAGARRLRSLIDSKRD